MNNIDAELLEFSRKIDITTNVSTFTKTIELVEDNSNEYDDIMNLPLSLGRLKQSFSWLVHDIQRD
jgi:hypothetical protein